MIPYSVNMPYLLEEAESQDLVISNHYPTYDEKYAAQYQEIIDKSAAGEYGLGHLKIVLIPESISGIDLTDVAKRVRTETDSDSVLVLTPRYGILSTDNYSISETTKNISLISSADTRPVAVEEYLDTLEGADVNFTVVSVLIFVGIMMTVLVTAYTHFRFRAMEWVLWRRDKSEV